MSQQVATIERRSLIVDMASRYSMEPAAFAATLRATVVPKTATNEEFAAFLMVAKEYSLNPITKEIYAFPKQGGGIQPIVSVDGWANLINSNPQCDGFDFVDSLNDKGEIVSITCNMHRKDRKHPISATEYMTECKRDTSTWKQWPRRMLRHKALIQAARYAFGFAGIVDPDEAERFTSAPKDHGYAPPPAPRIAPPSPPTPPPAPKTTAPEPITEEVEAELDRASLREMNGETAERPSDELADYVADMCKEAAKASDMAALDSLDDQVCAEIDSAHREDLRPIWNAAYMPRKDALKPKARSK